VTASLPNWLRVQAVFWLPVLIVQGFGWTQLPWAALCGAMALSFLSVCALLRALRTAADLVTVVRCAGVVAVTYAAPPDLPWLVWFALVALAALDLLDGMLARRFGATAQGAVLDMEADQITVLALALLVDRDGGPPWILLAPGLRYVFVAAMWTARLPAHDPKPKGGDNRRGRTCCAIVVIALLAALLPGLPPPLVDLAAALAVSVLVFSFASDARFLLRGLRRRIAA